MYLILHFIDEDNTVIYVDFHCGLNSYPETPSKITPINGERSYISRSCEKTKCIPSNDQHNCFSYRQYKTDNFLNTKNLWDMVPAALMSPKHTNDRYSMSNQYPQPSTNQPRTDSYPVLSSLRTMDSKMKRLRVRFEFFQRNYLPDGRVNETVVTVEELSDIWKTGAMDGIPAFVMNCKFIQV